MIFVVPVPGGLVRMYPTREVMPPDGAYVPDDIYWNRRLLHKDVTLGAAPTPPVTEQPVIEQIPSAAPEPAEESTDKKRPRKRDIKTEVDK
jgi:hypothetical protein